jgi:hypothetical protein
VANYETVIFEDADIRVALRALHDAEELPGRYAIVSPVPPSRSLAGDLSLVSLYMEAKR